MNKISFHKLAMRRAVVSLLIASFAQQSLAGNLAPNALPTGGNVTAGNATISQSGNVMNINQSSQRAVVSWQSFNVGKDATVNFNQQNSSSSTLNVVNGASKSMIDGAVNAQGQVIFVNNNGVVFGKNAEVNAGGVVATTMNVNQEAYMAGKNTLTYEGGQSGKVINKGRITATSLDGYIALMAPQVKNEGVITALMSGANSVALVSGQKVTLTFNNGQALKVSVDASAIKSLIENKRLIQTNGGQIILAANSAQDLMGSTIKNTGTVSADGVRRDGGQVFLVAENVTQSGTVSANSDTAAAGQVAITGKNITLTKSSKTTAIGASAGGQVLVGTNNVVQAQNTLLAQNVTIAQGALVDVSATQNGNGGSISIWSSIQTAVAGTLKAMGGLLGGNGGFIETSSKGSVILNAGVSINTSAPNGKSGTWLLDPIDLVIDSQAANVISGALNNNNVTISVAGNACPSIGACTQNGTGALTIAAAIQKVSGLSTTLSLLSTGAFNLNADISGQNLNVVISSSIAYLNVGTTINAQQVTVQAQSIYANGNINASSSDTLGGAISLLAQAIYISGRLNASAGSNTSSTGTTPSSVSYNGQVICREDLPAFLAAQNTGTNNLALDQVFSSTAANDPNVAAPSWNPAKQNNVIYLLADQAITLSNTAQVIANGTNNVVSQIYVTAPTMELQTGSLIQANGNNGPGGQVFISANQATFSGSITANGDLAGGSVSASMIGALAVNGLIQANGNNGPGGSISLLSNQDIQINQAQISASGYTDGGSLVIISNAGNTNIQSSLIQTNGSNGRGGSIGISAQSNVTIQSSSIEATGYSQGGTIKIGNDASNGTLPFALFTTLDSATTINASALNPDQNNAVGGFIETSGSTVQLLASINAGRGGMWLIDPTDIIVDSTTAASIVSGLVNNSVTIQTSASLSPTCTNATCSNTQTQSAAGNIVITSSISTNTNNNLTFAAAGAILVNGGVNIWLNNSNGYSSASGSSSNSSYTSGSGTGSLLMGGTSVSSITTSNWNGTCSGCYASATTASPYAGIGLGVINQANISGITLTAGSVSIQVGGNITIAGSNALSSNAYTGIALYSGSTVYAGSSTHLGNIYFYGISSAGAGMQLAWGASTPIDVRASQAIYAYGNSGYNDTTSTTGSDKGHGVYINISTLSAPTIQITGYNTTTCTGAASNCAGVSLGWITDPAQIVNIYTNNLNITADSVALGKSPVNVAVCNGNCGGTSTLGSPVATFGLNFAAYSQSSNVPTAAMTFYYYSTGTTATSSTTMPMPGSNYGAYLVLPTTATTWSSYAFSSNISMSIASGYTFTVAGPVSLTGTQITIAGTLSSTGLVTISNSDVSTISGTLTGGASFAKSGTGTLTITSAQSYTSTTTVSAGTLQMGSGGSIASSSGLTMSGSANFDLNGNSTTVGSLAGVSGNSIYNSATTTTAVLTVSGGATTYAGLIKDNTGAGGTVALTVNGASLTLSGTNTYTGGTTINAGILEFAPNASFAGAVGAVTSGPVGVGSVTINGGGTLDLNGNGASGASGGNFNNQIIMSGTSSSSQAMLINSSASQRAGSWGSITLSNASTAGALGDVFAQAAGSGYLQIWSVISDGTGTNYSGVQVGTMNYAGTVQFAGGASATTNGLNTYKGGTTIAYGRLQVGVDGTVSGQYMHFYCGSAASKCTTAGGTNLYSGPIGVGTITINGGGTLDVGSTGNAGSAYGYFNNPIVMAGTSVSAAYLVNGSLYSTVAGLVSGPVTLLNASSPQAIVDVIGASPKTPFGTSSFTSGLLTVQSIISDGTGSNYAGLQIGSSSYTGTVVLSGANTYSGGTSVNGGVLQFGSNYTTTALAVTNSPIGTGNLTINSGGTLDINNHNFGTSTQSSNSPTITMSGVDANNQAFLTDSVSGSYNYIYGQIILSNISAATNTLANVIFTSNTLYVPALISDGSGANYAGLQIGKSSYAGTVQISGANTYSGLTSVSYGVLQLGAAGSGANSPLGLANSGTVVTSGAALDLNGYTLATTESLTINGTGISGGGALKNSSGAATYAGLLTLGSASSVISGSGAITLSNIGTITGAYGLTLGGVYGGSIASIIGTGANTVTKQDGGTWTLTGLNTYTGATTVSGGILNVTNLADGGIASSIGQSTNAATNLVFSGGNLRYSGTTNASTDRLFTVSATGAGALTLSTNSTASLTFSNTGSIVNSAASANTITFSPTMSSSLTFNSILGDPSSGSASVIIASSGTVVLGGLNTYTGTTSINNGTLSVSNLANGGSPSAIGQSSNAATNLVFGGGALVFTGISATTDRLFKISSTNPSINTGSGTLIFSNTGSIINSSPTVAVLTLLGTGAGTLDLILPNASGGYALGVTLSGSGTWTLSGANTYSNGTSVTGGGILQFGSNSYFYCGGTQICNSANTTTSSSPIGTGTLKIPSGTLDLNGNGSSSTFGNFYNSLMLGPTTGLPVTVENSNSVVSAGVYGTIALDLLSNGWFHQYVFKQAGGSARLIIGGALSDGTYSTNATPTGIQVGDSTNVGTVVMSGVNTFTSAGSNSFTMVNSGTLQISSDANLGAAPVSATRNIELINGGTLLLSGQSSAFTIGSTRTITLGTGGGTIANNSALYPVTIAGLITGSSQLTIGSSGNSGTVALLGQAVTYSSTSYSGATYVTSGATLDLQINLACTTIISCGFNSTYSGAGSIILEPATTGWAVDLGATSGSNTSYFPASLFASGGKFANGFSNITIGSSSAGNLSVTGTAAFSDSVTLMSGGNITINSGASVTSSQASGNLAIAASGNFINNAGSSALSETGGGGRWFVYSTNPSADTFGPSAAGTLVSGNKAYWGSTYSSLAPSAVTGSGNYYIFSTGGTVTVTTTNASMTYGAPIDLSSNYTVSNPSLNAAPTGNPYIANGVSDLFATTPTISSLGNTSTASVGTYTISGTGATGATGFTIAYSNAGTLTVNPAPITLSIVGSKTYDGTAVFNASPSNSNVTVSGLVNGDTLATVTANSPNVSANGSNYFTSFTMGSGTASNYLLVSGYNAATNSATINAATVAIVGANNNVTYNANTQTNSGATVNINGSGATAISGTTVNTGIGSESFTLSGYGSGANASTTAYADHLNLTAGSNTTASNYTITYTNGSLTIGKATANVSATKTYDGGTTLSNSQISITGVGGVTLGFTQTSAATSDANVTTSNKYVSLGNLALSGGISGTSNDPNNYVLPSSAYNATSNKVTINAATVAIVGANNNVTYNANTQTNSGATVNINGSGATAISGTTVNTGIGSESFTLSGYGSGANASTTAYADHLNLTAGSNTTASNYTITYTNGSLTIGKANLAITAIASTSGNVYNGSAYTGTYTTTFLGSDASHVVISGVATGTDAATYASNLSVANASGYTVLSNYNTPTIANANLVVSPATLTITANAATKVYGSTATYGAGSTAFTPTGLVNGQTIGSVTITDTNNGGVATANAGGTYYLTPSAATGGTFTPANYSITYVPGVLTVSQATLNIGVSKTYDGSAILHSYDHTVLTTTGGVYVYDAQITGTVTTSSSNVGSYTSFVSGGFSLVNSSNYTLVGGTTTATINVKIVNASGTKNYDASAVFNYAQLTVNSGVAGETINLTGGSGTASSANAATYSNSSIGGVTITVSGGNALASNYVVSTVGTLTITPRPITLTATSQSTTYGTALGLGTTAYTVGGSGLASGDAISAVTLQYNGSATVAGNTNAATYSSGIVASGATGSGGFNTTNYAISYASGNLTVNAAPLTITGTKVYDGSGNFTYTQMAVTGARNGETVSLTSGGATTTSGNVNSYNGTSLSGLAINVSGGNALASNYSLPATGSLGITQRSITITATSQSTTYGTALGLGTTAYTVGGSGLASGDAISAVTLQYNGSATVAGNTNAATYNNGIVASGATGSGGFNTTNYAISYAPANLLVNPKPVTITNNTSSTTYDGTSTYANLVSAAGFSVSAMVGSDAIRSVTQAIACGGSAVSGVAQAGSFTATPSAAVLSIGSANNYSFTYVAANDSVAKANLSVTGANTNTTYNGTLQTNTYHVSGILGSDSVTGVSGLATGTNASATAYADSLANVVGNGLSNYNITYVNGGMTIGKANLTATGAQAYNGTTTFNGSNLTISGVNGETFIATGTADMSSKNVQSSQPLANVNGLTLVPVGSALASNYNAINVANTAVSVTPLSVVLTAPVINKTYDGSVVYTMTSSDLSNMSAQLSGGDQVSAASVQFTNANAGTNKTVLLQSVSINDGNGGHNYNVTLQASNTSVINKALLTITAANDAKFVTQTDLVGSANNCGSGVACAGGYAGLITNGFVNGETTAALTGSATITRTNSTVNSAGTYTGVLQPSGYSSSNYTITYVNGNYTIVPAQTLLVRVIGSSNGPVTTTYGSTPVYSDVTAQYLNSSNNVITSLTPVVNGSAVSVSDGVGGSASFTLSPSGATNSSSGHTNAGTYTLIASGALVSGNNFNSLSLVGSLAVNPMSLSAAQLGVTGVSKVYDGNANISGLVLNVNPITSQILSGDNVSVLGTGTFADQNVGTNKSVTINLALSGVDAGNYALSSNALTSNIGTITQLASVTYTGTSGGNWSNSTNWAGGATPTLNNVANVIIPTGKTVVYDAALVGSIGSTITDNGAISFNGNTNFTLANNVSGTGSINQSGVGVLTLSGNNTLSGGININSSSLIAASANALGNSVVNSNGGSFAVAAGTILSSLTINGPVNLVSDITTAGAQTYNGAVTLGSGYAQSGVITPMQLAADNADITFNGTLQAGANSYANMQSLSINAGSGQVTFGDTVGSSILSGNGGFVLYTSNYFNNPNIYNLDVTAGKILLKGNITTFGTQTYNGAVVVSDNGSNGNTRILLSEDPAVTFNSTVDDGSLYGHNLVVEAISIGGNSTPSITFNGAVNSITSLNSLMVKTGVQDTTPADNPLITDLALNSSLGRGNIVGLPQNVNQTYSYNQPPGPTPPVSGNSGSSSSSGTNGGQLSAAINLGNQYASLSGYTFGEVVVGDDNDDGSKGYVDCVRDRDGQCTDRVL